MHGMPRKPAYEDHALGRPLCRATITARSVTLNPWSPGLLHAGPAAMNLRRLRDAGVLLADLFVCGEDDELVVTPVPGLTVRDDHAGAVLAWARRTGYGRVWLPDEVVELPGEVPAARAHVECPTCGLEWEDESVRFWESVSRDHLFPAYCVACGGSLPEWEVDEENVVAERPQREIA